MKKELYFAKLLVGVAFFMAPNHAYTKPAAKRAPLRRLMPAFPPAAMRAPISVKPLALTAIASKPRTIKVFHPEAAPQEAAKAVSGAPVSKVIHVQPMRAPMRTAPVVARAKEKNRAPIARVVAETPSREATLY
ncbi:MAG TPA: hypothetical protein VF681_02920 [Abditibacteriaceae bacterium]|jgi:hypothetical protein